VVARADQFRDPAERDREGVMLAAEKRKTNIGVGIGIALMTGGAILEGAGSVILIGIPNLLSVSPLAGVMMVAGMASFTWGCFMYAQGKGYSQLMGLFGLLSFVGLVILALMPDRHPEKAKGAAPSASDPRPTA
jgi:hypothetical protein